MDEQEKLILSKARKLDRLEKDYLKYSYECKKPENENEMREFLGKSFSIAQEAFEIKNEIKLELSKITNLSVFDFEALKTIRKIKNDDRFYSISFYENIAEMLNKNVTDLNEQLDLSSRDYLMNEKYYEIFDEFHTWFDVCSYYNDKMDVGAIISSAIIPKRVLPYFNEIRESYAFGQYRASMALCRALLEMVLYEKLNQLKALEKYKKGQDEKYKEGDNGLFFYIKLAKYKKIISGDDELVAHKIRDDCNKVLHLKDDGNEPIFKNTFRTIINTISLVESIYK